MSQDSAQPGGTVRIERPTEPSYLYAATVLNVVDGDTLDLTIDLGFHTDRRGRFRLADIDAPELDTKAGRAARDFVVTRLANARTLVVKTQHAQRTDLYGRYIAHVFYSPTQVDIDACFQTGTHLNNELLDDGHAELLVMGG